MFNVIAAQSPRRRGRAWTLNAYSFCVMSSYKSSLCDLCLINTNLCNTLYVHLFKRLQSVHSCNSICLFVWILWSLPSLVTLKYILSSVGIVTKLGAGRSWVHIPLRAVNFLFSKASGTLDIFRGGKPAEEGVILTIYLHLAAKSLMSGAVPPHPSFPLWRG
jgi:hypothetical protein